MASAGSGPPKSSRRSRSRLVAIRPASSSAGAKSRPLRPSRARQYRRTTRCTDRTSWARERGSWARASAVRSRVGSGVVMVPPPGGLGRATRTPTRRGWTERHEGFGARRRAVCRFRRGRSACSSRGAGHGRSGVSGYFERVDAGAFRATEHVGGAWRQDEQHIAPALGLLVHAVECDRDVRRDDGLVLGRLSFDILGTLPIDVVEVGVRVLRPGRTIELVEATLAHGGRTAVLL